MINKIKKVFFSEYDIATEADGGEVDRFLELQQGNMLNKVMHPVVKSSVQNKTPIKQEVQSYENWEVVYLNNDFEDYPEFNAANEVAYQVQEELSPVVSTEVTANPLSNEDIMSSERKSMKMKQKDLLKIAGGIGVLYLLLS